MGLTNRLIIAQLPLHLFAISMENLRVVEGNKAHVGLMYEKC
jgi:hypothetical protein